MSRDTHTKIQNIERELSFLRDEINVLETQLAQLKHNESAVEGSREGSREGVVNIVLTVT